MKETAAFGRHVPSAAYLGAGLGGGREAVRHGDEDHAPDVAVTPVGSFTSGGLWGVPARRIVMRRLSSGSNITT